MIWIAILLPLILIGGYFAYKNTKNVQINKVKVKASDQTAAPLHILHLSDLHLENISITPGQLYEKLKHDHYDLIALTGDFLDRKWTIPKLVPYLKVFKELDPTYGIYAVFGNHDYVLRPHNFKKLKQTLKEHDCKVLQNTSDTLIIHGRRINIIGIDNYSTGHSDLKASYEGVETGYNLVLTHDPNIVLEMDDYPFDYLLSGHFHGGQILYPKAYHLVKMGKLPRMNMIKGLNNHKGRTFYISEGLGQTGLNIRVGSRPEVTMHKIAE